MLVLAPIVLVIGFWFLILSPKRSESVQLGDKLTKVEQARDNAESNAQRLEGARSNYAKDYETVVRLGKAVPSTVDMPSLLVQLDSAAKGTGIAFDSLKAGPRTTAAAPAGAPAAPGDKPAAAAGGEKAQTGPGQAAEKADNAKSTSEQGSAAGGSAPPAGGAQSAPAGTTPAPPGLDTVPLGFDFTGSFFELADFFHRMKRFVRVANGKISVTGRLMTIDSMNFKATNFPTINATVQATVYLSPKSEGATAGGTPSGPGPQRTAAPASTTAAGSGTPAGSTP